MRKPVTQLGAMIRSGRLELGLSAQKLSTVIGVRRQTISQWEVGNTKPNISKLKSLAKALNLDLKKLQAASQGELDERQHITSDKLEILHAAITFDEMIDAEKNVRKGSTVIIASLFKSKEDENYKVTSAVKENIERGIEYIFAFPEEETFYQIKKFLADQFVNRQLPSTPKFCKLKLNDDILLNPNICKVISNALVILDESGTDSKVAPKVRGYQYVEFARPSENENMDGKVFFPVAQYIVNDLRDIARDRAKELNE